jgi:hypothetical protein
LPKAKNKSTVRMKGIGRHNNSEAMENEDVATTAKNDSYRAIHDTIMMLAAKYPEASVKLKSVLVNLDVLLKETIKKATKDATTAVQNENEMALVAKSVIVFNLNKMKIDKKLYDKAPVEEVLTEALLRFTRHRITVQDVAVLARDEKGVPTMARVVLGSSRQRAILYRLLGEMGRGARMEAADMIRALSFRDMFLKEHMEKAKEQTQKGLALKRVGTVHTFRVAAQGTGCVPILQVKSKPKDRWVSWTEGTVGPSDTVANAADVLKPKRVALRDGAAGGGTGK